jgi:hypothetical protein
MGGLSAQFDVCFTCIYPERAAELEECVYQKDSAQHPDIRFGLLNMALRRFTGKRGGLLDTFLWRNKLELECGASNR